MRIALVSTPFIPVPPAGYGGTELFCYELAQELSRRGHDLTLYTTGDSTAQCRRRALYLQPEWPPTAADELNHVAWAVAEAARAGSEVVHVQSSFGVALSRFIRVPMICTLHHQREAAFSRIFTVHPEVEFVAISRRQLELEVPLAHVRVIHHGLSTERYPVSHSHEGYLAHVGRYCAEKGTAVAIDAARLAGMPIVLAGRTHPQDEAYFEAEVRPRLRGSDVTEVGEAAHDRKLEILRGARALLCPLAWEEPFGLVAIEAMLCGTPVVGFPRGAFPEIVDAGVTGFLARDRDVTELARCAQRAQEIDRLRCAQRARERFSVQVMASAYERAYRDAALRGARHAHGRAA